MQQSYTKNYIKIYLFQAISVLLGFVSMFVVIPYISSNQTIYGIYAVCISITIFLSYADLGFLGAGQKYASESYAKGDHKREMDLIGFSHFILFVVVLLICCVFLYLSYHPQLLINDLQNEYEQKIASNLLFILSIFSPIIVLQRMLQMIFGIRLQEYNLQKINILGNSIKILSVFYFFRSGHYDIVGYYLFVQIIVALVAVTGLFYAKRIYNYDFKYLLTRFRFSSDIFRQTKGLAFSALFMTISWVLYYELDSIAIGKLLNAESIAIYAIGLTLLGFIRTIFGVIFSPFSARFNHFIGEGKNDELKQFYLYVVSMTFPLVVFPLVAISIMAKGVVFSWVGVDYEQSVVIVRWLMLCNILAFITYPTNLLIVAKERLKDVYWISAIMSIIFWIGVMLTINHYGVVSFAVFKFIAFIVAGLISCSIAIRYIGFSISSFFKRVIMPYIPGLIIMVAYLFLMKDTFVTDKSKVNLLLNTALIGSGIALASGVSICFNSQLRDSLIKVLASIIPHKEL